MPSIALTGATGFVGRVVLQRLRSQFKLDHVRVLVRNSAERSLASPFDQVEVIDGDLSDADALRRLVDGCDAVVHLAAAIAGNAVEDFDRVNVEGTQRLIEALSERTPRAHLIKISSLAAREPALSWYSASKARAEQCVLKSGLRYSILRPPAVYGPGDPALADFWRFLARGWLLRLGPDAARFSLLHVEDLAEATARLVEHGPTEQTMTLHDGHCADGQNGWRWSDLAHLAEVIGGRSVRVVPIHSSLLYVIAAINLQRAKLFGPPAMLNPGKHRELIHPDWVCDNRRIADCLAWQPTTTLRQTLDTLPGWTNPH
ncbi:MAG: NAD-dependent epimerase/dehydratase family protein [Pseudomonadota bacterium]